MVIASQRRRIETRRLRVGDKIEGLHRCRLGLRNDGGGHRATHRERTATLNSPLKHDRPGSKAFFIGGAQQGQRRITTSLWSVALCPRSVARISRTGEAVWGIDFTRRPRARSRSESARERAAYLRSPPIEAISKTALGVRVKPESWLERSGSQLSALNCLAQRQGSPTSWTASIEFQPNTNDVSSVSLIACTGKSVGGNVATNHEI